MRVNMETNPTLGTKMNVRRRPEAVCNFFRSVSIYLTPIPPISREVALRGSLWIETFVPIDQ